MTKPTPIYKNGVCTNVAEVMEFRKKQFCEGIRRIEDDFEAKTGVKITGWELKLKDNHD